MLEGLAALKKFGLASFCSPAKQKVKPRNARRGSIAQPERVEARGGGASKRTRRRRRAAGPDPDPDARALPEALTGLVRCAMKSFPASNDAPTGCTT